MHLTLFYLLNRTAPRACLCASVGLKAGSPAAPHAVKLPGRAPAWPLRTNAEGAYQGLALAALLYGPNLAE
jgi:hypothetical protein